MDLIFVIIMVVMIYVVLENNKINQIFNRIHRIDIELEKEIKDFILPSGELNIFTIQEIRSMITNKFLDVHKIDEFKIYKESMYKISLVLRLGLAVQTLELITNDSSFRLTETSIAYSNIDFSNN